MRADKGLTNLRVVYMEGDILAWRYDWGKWYWFSEHWNEISLGISKQSATTNQIHFLKKLSFYLTSKWVRFSVICYSYRIMNKFIPGCRWWIGVTDQPAEMINSIYKSNDIIYNRADTLKSDSN